MAFDRKSERVFIGSRDPGKLFVMNARDGSIVQTLDIVNTSEDMTVDAAHRHLCITGSTGLDVVDPVGPDRYAVKQHLDTLDGKTSVYIPSLQLGQASDLLNTRRYLGLFTAGLKTRRLCRDQIDSLFSVGGHPFRIGVGLIQRRNAWRQVIGHTLPDNRKARALKMRAGCRRARLTDWRSKTEHPRPL
ncbi:YncE family protein [Paraburkholderia kirstenboschensis]|jgi:hypothetical protein|uniref:Uncharacterized protein n=1 Tax=Paraburkholderia kirstenboschensis TaxID=1245436 RepID=A0ABZ0E9A0_9BURK|nr:hypothetical protein [Paraburkholderia kirstenboschensis]WOD13786.1 hypothetical protein RW095_07485 [Paraburkholderia kirstenboschensis]